MEYILTTPSIATLAEYFILFFCNTHDWIRAWILESHTVENSQLADSGFPCGESENKNVTFCNSGFILLSPNQMHILWKNSLLFNNHECEDDGLLIWY